MYQMCDRLTEHKQELKLNRRIALIRKTTKRGTVVHSKIKGHTGWAHVL